MVGFDHGETVWVHYGQMNLCLKHSAMLDTSCLQNASEVAQGEIWSNAISVLVLLWLTTSE